MTTHVFRRAHEEYEAIVEGRKGFVLAPSQNPAFRPGDRIELIEVEGDLETGRRRSADITYLTSADNPCALSDSGLRPGFSILSLSVWSA